MKIHCRIMYSLFGLLGLLTPMNQQAGEAAEPHVAFPPAGDWQLAPHRQGNVYAPEVRRDGASLRMWFGAQGIDGHDRIMLAESTDGRRWRQRGVVLEDASANHCNDPSVVEAHGQLWMFYTRAAAGVIDEISVAVSSDGVSWEPRGTALAAGAPGAWDSLAVGRPSVLFVDGKFHMWYDGRRDLPIGAPDATAPQSAGSQRHVGYATSDDGLQWRRVGATPVFDHNAGGVHVVKIGPRYAMLFESQGGTDAATSDDGVNWRPLGRLVERADVPRERYGHVTPFLLLDAAVEGATVYYGAAAAPTWDSNAIASRRLTPVQWRRLRAGK